MINVLANRKMHFDHPTDKAQDVVTEIGFNSLPDWVRSHDYYGLGVLGGELKPFEGSSEKTTEEVLKQQKAVDDLELKHKALEEKIATTTSNGQAKRDALKKEVDDLIAQKAALAEELKAK